MSNEIQKLDRVHFGNVLKKTRKAIGYNQTEFADLLGVSQNAISNWELGKREPENIDTLLNISHILDLPMSALINEKSYKEYLESESLMLLADNTKSIEEFEQFKTIVDNSKISNDMKVLYIQIAAKNVGKLDEYKKELTNSESSPSFILFDGNDDELLGYSNTVDKIRQSKKENNIIPILGTVPCGVPIEAIEDIIDYEEVTEQMAKTGTYFGLKAQGDSMYPQIIDGDTLIIKQTTTVNSGDIAIVKVNGDEATCKKVIFNDYGITLVSFNSAYEPMIYSKDDIEKLPITICGKVVESKRSY